MGHGGKDLVGSQCCSRCHAAVGRDESPPSGAMQHVRQEEQTELVNDFATATSTIVAAIDVEGILCEDG